MSPVHSGEAEEQALKYSCKMTELVGGSVEGWRTHSSSLLGVGTGAQPWHVALVDCPHSPQGWHQTNSGVCTALCDLGSFINQCCEPARALPCCWEPALALPCWTQVHQLPNPTSLSEARAELESGAGQPGGEQGFPMQRKHGHCILAYVTGEPFSASLSFH